LGQVVARSSQQAEVRPAATGHYATVLADITSASLMGCDGACIATDQSMKHSSGNQSQEVLAGLVERVTYHLVERVTYHNVEKGRKKGIEKYLKPANRQS
jgi:hypothetical protein